MRNTFDLSILLYSLYSILYISWRPTISAKRTLSLHVLFSPEPLLSLSLSSSLSSSNTLSSLSFPFPSLAFFPLPLPPSRGVICHPPRHGIQEVLQPRCAAGVSNLTSGSDEEFRSANLWDVQLKPQTCRARPGMCVFFSFDWKWHLIPHTPSTQLPPRGRRRRRLIGCDIAGCPNDRGHADRSTRRTRTSSPRISTAKASSTFSSLHA